MDLEIKAQSGNSAQEQKNICAKRVAFEVIQIVCVNRSQKIGY